MRMTEVTLPVSCAPYLINGDDSDGRAVYEADRVCANVNINPASCLSIGDEWIARWNGVLTAVATFTFDANVV